MFDNFKDFMRDVADIANAVTEVAEIVGISADNSGYGENGADPICWIDRVSWD